MRRLLLAFIMAVVFPLPLALADTLCSFNGTIDFANKGLQFQADLGPRERISGSLNIEGDAVSLNCQIEHLKIGGTDLTTSVEGSFYIRRGPAQEIKDIKGYLWTKYTLFNYKPSQEMVASFYVRDGRLGFDELTWAETAVSGDINLYYPFDVNLNIKISDMDINEAASLVGVNRDNLLLSGLVNGEVRLSGQWRSLKLKGNLSSAGGQIQDFVYRDCLINFAGNYPVLDIENSTISDEEGLIYRLKGRFNLLEINNFVSSEHNIVVSPFSESTAGLRALTIRKREELGQDSEVEFGYRLRSVSPADTRDSGGEGILGIEHRHKF